MGICRHSKTETKSCSAHPELFFRISEIPEWVFTTKLLMNKYLESPPLGARTYHSQETKETVDYNHSFSARIKTNS